MDAKKPWLPVLKAIAMSKATWKLVGEVITDVSGTL